ncbi:hypothetical protein HanHA300_Chr03g0109781 [Helianthus annuus]|nr:hypothetical protein HanHA300_Chr03g0109781 [Helianthus annuus]KAJ0769637.1 hypothetical protein HanLR1_Chr03g0114951 [Helianthus annuus]
MNDTWSSYQPKESCSSILRTVVIRFLKTLHTTHPSSCFYTHA